MVLSSQRVDLDDTLYTRGQREGRPDVNPLIQDGQKLIPSVTRVFSKNRDMYVYLQAYERGAGHPAAGGLRDLLSRAGEGLRNAAAAGDRRMENRLKTVPLKFSLALGKLPPGKYNCQVTVLDPTSQKAAFWQAPVMLVP